MAKHSDGSWFPAIVIVVALVARWICYGNGDTAMKLRRWFNTQVRIYCIPDRSADHHPDGCIYARRGRQKLPYSHPTARILCTCQLASFENNTEDQTKNAVRISRQEHLSIDGRSRRTDQSKTPRVANTSTAVPSFACL
jgi:hypothetical protein